MTTELLLSDRIDPARALALAATLGLDRDITAALPPLFHLVYFWQAEPADRLGRDGHPARGGLIPDHGLPRRMWAGGRFHFHAPLRPGITATRRTTVEATTRKSGRSGPLAFVTLRHDIRQAGRLCLTEWQELLYRSDPDPEAPQPEPPRAPGEADRSRRHVFSTTELFRYSALSFNGHRIHYDLQYAREVEAYPGLVVHGPLLAQHLALMAEAALGPLKRFQFRATAPLIQGEEALLRCRDQRFWVAGPDGRLCLEAEAEARG